MAFIDFLRRVDFTQLLVPSKEEKQAHGQAVQRFKDAFGIKDGVPYVRPDGEVLCFNGAQVVSGGKRGNLRDQTAALNRAAALKSKVADPATGFTDAQQVVLNEILEFSVFQ